MQLLTLVDVGPFYGMVPFRTFEFLPSNIGIRVTSACECEFKSLVVEEVGIHFRWFKSRSRFQVCLPLKIDQKSLPVGLEIENGGGNK